MRWAVFRANVVVVVAFAVVIGASVPARAHPLADQARSRYAEADFDAVLAICDRAEQATDLSRADLAELLASCVLADVAVGDDARLQRDAARLVSLDPSFDLGARSTPAAIEALRAARQRAGGALTLALQVHIDGGAARVEAAVSRDAGELVRRVRVFARVGGEEWRESDQGALALPSVRPGEEIQAYAEAIGIGGATVATSGSRDEPRRESVPLPLDLEMGEDAASSAPVDEGGGFPWVWLGVGAAVLVAAAVITILLVGSGPTGDTQPTVPEL